MLKKKKSLDQQASASLTELTELLKIWTIPKKMFFIWPEANFAEI